MASDPLPPNPDPDQLDIPATLEAIGRARGWTQKRLAKHLKVAELTISRWVHRGHKPRPIHVDTILALARESGLGGGILRTEPMTAPSQPLAVSRVRPSKAHPVRRAMRACLNLLRRPEMNLCVFATLAILLLLKRLSDVFDDEIELLSQKLGDRQAALEAVERNLHYFRFYLPPEARWATVREYVEKHRNNPREFLESLVRTLGHARTALLWADPSPLVHGNGQDLVAPQALLSFVPLLSEPRCRLGLADISAQELGDIYESLLREFAENLTHKEHLPPADVKYLVALLLQPRPGERCHDPTCADGHLLLAVDQACSKASHEKHAMYLTGQSLDPVTRLLALVNSQLRGVYVGLSLNATRRGAYPEVQSYDAVVSDHAWFSAFFPGDLPRDIATDPDSPARHHRDDHDDGHRSLLARAAYTSRERLWAKRGWGHVEWVVSLLKPRGRAVLVMSPSVVSHRASLGRLDWVRKRIIEEDLLRAVVHLQAGTLRAGSRPCVVLALAREKTRDFKDRILFVRAHPRPQGEGEHLTPEEICERIAALVEKGKPVAGEIAVQSLGDVVAAGYDLDPAHWIADERPSAETSLQGLKKLSDEENKISRTLATLLIDISKSLQPTGAGATVEVPPGWSKGVLGDFSERIEQGSTKPSAMRLIPGVLDMRDLREEGIDWERILEDLLDEVPASEALQPGDVLFPAVGSRLGKPFLLEQCPPVRFAMNVLRVRTKPDKLLPAFLCHQAQTDSFQALIDACKRAGERLQPADLASLPVVLPPLEVQQQLTACLRLAEQECSLVARKQAAAARLYTAIIRDFLR